jgi:hypothetical protein
LELLKTLWEKLYPNENPSLLSEVTKIFLDYWSKQYIDLPYGNFLPDSSSYSYWKMLKCTLNDAYRISADFSIRLSCAGVNECCVERVFSYIKWILGIKRFRLKPETVQNLICLRNQ